MFAKRNATITIDGVALLIIELTKKESRVVESAGDEHGTISKAFVLAVRKEDGTPFFANEAEVDELPTHVVQQIADAMKAMNEVKN